MNVTVDGYVLELSVTGGALVVHQNAVFKGALGLAEPPPDPVPIVLQSNESDT